MAIPRVFVSSTYYDLKHIRNSLKRFIIQYGYEAVLNEFGSIAYDYTKPLDKSCFKEIEECDILILIIGGRYGSEISDQISNGSVQKRFYDEYTSVTCEEYRKAYEKNIPIYIFIDKNVDGEFYTYQKNKNNKQVEYAHVDSINVYKFVEEIKGKFKNNIICSFEKFEDIEEWLKTQWAGMFHKYLSELRHEQSDSKIQDSISELEMVTKQMKEIIMEVEKKLIPDMNECEIRHIKKIG